MAGTMWTHSKVPYGDAHHIHVYNNYDPCVQQGTCHAIPLFPNGS